MPDIKHLDLNASPGQGRSDLTLDLLPAISYHCPKLRYLRLFIDCRILPPTEALADGYSRRSTLKEISLGNSPFNLGESQIIASWLDAFLPESCNVICYGDNSGEVKDALKLSRRAPDRMMRMNNG